MTLLPYAQIQHYLEPAEICALLDCVLSNEARFTPATVGPDGGSVVDLEQRISLTGEILVHCRIGCAIGFSNPSRC